MAPSAFIFMIGALCVDVAPLFLVARNLKALFLLSYLHFNPFMFYQTHESLLHQQQKLMLTHN
jgi:hypothetical protein